MRRTMKSIINVWPDLIIYALIAFASATAVHADPRQKVVTLSPHTAFTLDIDQDGGGTRFSFPFVLDEQDDNVPFTLDITNPAFTSKRLEGRNSFVVTLPIPANGASLNHARSSLFITVAGYEISVELRATREQAKAYSDVVFELLGDARETLIQNAIAQRAAVLEKDYQSKRATIETLADQRALAKIGKLAMSNTVTKRIKEEGQVTAANGTVVLFVDKTVSYGPYSILLFDIDNHDRNQVVTVQDAKLFSIDTRTNTSQPIEGGAELPQTVLPRSVGHGAVTVMTDQLLTGTRSLQLQVATDKGTVQAQW